MADRETRADSQTSPVSPDELVGSLNLAGCKTSDLRQVALLLNGLADVLDAKLNTGSQNHSRVNAKLPDLALASMAKRLYDARGSRSDFLPDLLFGEPAWDILLDLLYQEAIGRKVATTDALIAARVPATTALRYLGQLEHEGLIRRESEKGDQRKRRVHLTQKGASAMREYLHLLLKGEDKKSSASHANFLLRS
jgi:DNA-binding MarR family transcriptional regulator